LHPRAEPDVILEHGRDRRKCRRIGRLDQIPRIERPDLISGMESRLFNVFDRLRKVTDGGDGAATSPEKFLAGLFQDDE